MLLVETVWVQLVPMMYQRMLQLSGNSERICEDKGRSCGREERGMRYVAMTVRRTVETRGQGLARDQDGYGEVRWRMRILQSNDSATTTLT